MRAFRLVTASAVALASLVPSPAPLHAAAEAIVLVWQPSGAPADVDDGVHLGLSEAQQTAKLLGRDVRLEAAAALPRLPNALPFSPPGRSAAEKMGSTGSQSGIQC